MISRRDFLVRSGGIAAAGAVTGATYGRPAIHGILARGKGERPLDTFDLEVAITGLCLFCSPKTLPPGLRRQQQHVLMVAPMLNGPQCKLRDQDYPSVPQHYPRLLYDAAYDDSSVALGKYQRVVPLQGAVLDLFQRDSHGNPLNGDENNIPTIPDLLDLGPFAPYDLVDPAKPDDAPNPPNLACRVTLPPGQAASLTSTGWSLEGPNAQAGSPKKAAWLVKWTVHNIPSGELTLSMQSLAQFPNSIPVPDLKPLKPQNGKIRLTVSNVVLRESKPFDFDNPPPEPTPPQCNREATDFRAYFDLYAAGPGPWAKLFYRGTCPQAPQGTPYTCLPSGGH